MNIYTEDQQQRENFVAHGLHWHSLEVHPAAAEFPLLQAKEFEALKADIKLRGIRQPILRKGSVILDGRHRLAAAQELGLKPEEIPYEEYQGNDEVGEIIANNILRRHLTDEQRVAIVAKIRGPGIAEKAAQRQRAGLLQGGLNHEGKARGVDFNPTAPNKTRDTVALESKTTVSKARTALEVAKHAPEELDRVIEGKAKLSAAKKAADLKKADKRAGKFKPAKAAKPLEDVVKMKFIRFMDSFPITDHREVREVLRQLLRVGIDDP